MDGSILIEDPFKPVFESPQSPDYGLQELGNATANSIMTFQSSFDVTPLCDRPTLPMLNVTPVSSPPPIDQPFTP